MSEPQYRVLPEVSAVTPGGRATDASENSAIFAESMPPSPVVRTTTEGSPDVPRTARRYVPVSTDVRGVYSMPAR